MDNKDIRWIQRFSNYNKAFKKLERAVQLAKSRKLNELEQQGLIQAFEFTHELAWNTMKDYAFYQGNASVGGSRDATREAFTLGIIQDAHSWMAMINSRNKTPHTYNQEVADEIANHIIEVYYGLFDAFQQTMEEKRSGEQSSPF